MAPRPPTPFPRSGQARALATLAAVALLVFFAPPSLPASPGTLFGDWKTPDGSVIRTFPCAKALCMKIVTISATAPGTLDARNPDPKLHTRPLCNLEIGSNFALTSDIAASGGLLYDPESGHTYKGNIELNGDTLKLRGYIGISLFGRTELWHRTANPQPCA